MQCGESIWCVLLQWLAEHGAAKELVEGLEPFVRGDEQAVAHVYERIKSIITVGVTLISGSFAIWKWWHFREAVLHKRLAEYIGESDRRLTPSRNEVVELISRPDRRTNLRQPAFALELGHVLRRNNWEPRISRVLGDNIPDREFEKITEQIDKRIRTADAALSALKEQRAAANIIAGALASARSSRTRDPATARRYSEEAFHQFHNAEGHLSDFVAIEGQAFQLLRLGQYEQSYREFLRLFNAAEILPIARDKALIQSRAQRYLGLIGYTAPIPRCSAGWDHLQPDAPKTSIGLRAEFESSLRKWELVEHAEINYTTAFVARRKSFVKIEPVRLAEAERAYNRVLAPLPRYRPLLLASERRLQSTAREGLVRVLRAKTGDYDLAFLHQPVGGSGGNAKDPQNPTQPVSPTGSDDGVKNTP